MAALGVPGLNDAPGVTIGELPEAGELYNGAFFFIFRPVPLQAVWRSHERCIHFRIVNVPAFRIDVDRQAIATVRLDGMELVIMYVSGSLDDSTAGFLDVYGGVYSGGAEGRRIWVDALSLQSGQEVTISFLDASEHHDQGHTLLEIYPEAASADEFDFTPTDAAIAEFRARPRLRDAFTFQVDTSGGLSCTVGSDATNDRFSFTVVWDGATPHEARMSVRSECREDVIARRGGTCHLRGKLAIGASATCAIT